MSSQQPLQTNILGFEGPPATLFSSYDADAMILTVVATMPYQPKPREGCLVISNDTTMHRDSPFTDRDMKDAIGAYFQLRDGFAVDGKSTRLNFGRRAKQIQADAQKDGREALAGAKAAALQAANVKTAQAAEEAQAQINKAVEEAQAEVDMLQAQIGARQEKAAKLIAERIVNAE